MPSYEVVEEFTFRGDDSTKLLLEPVTDIHWGGYRVCALSSGNLADWVWTTLAVVAEQKFGVAQQDEFTRLLDEEYAVVLAALPDRRDSLRLQPILGDFLHVLVDPSGSFTFNMAGFAPFHRPYWAMPGSIKTVHETTPRRRPR